MKGYIDGIDFSEMENQRYWAFPKTYRGDPKEETRNMIFSGDYIGARKIDGAFYKFIKDEDGNMMLLGRSRNVDGEFLDKFEWVPQLHDFFNALPNGTCLLGELYFPNKEGSRHVTTIMGCLVEKAIERQEKGDKLHYYVFDILAFDGQSYLKMPVEERIAQLALLNTTTFFQPNLHFAEYFEGKKLWTLLQMILGIGGEGIVITRKGTSYQPGKRPARQTLKVKKELQNTIDCFFTGKISAPTRLYTGKEIETWRYWEDTRTGKKITGQKYHLYEEGQPIEPVTKPYYYGWAGSLEIGLMKDGKVVGIGWLSGLPDLIKGDPQAYKGKVIEVAAMETFDDTKALRHAKMLQFREDKTMEECTWDQLEQV